MQFNRQEEFSMKNIGRNAFGYGYPAPVLLVGTYNDDGTANSMNLH